MPCGLLRRHFLSGAAGVPIAAAGRPNPVYLTIVMHNEEGGRPTPLYLDREFYLRNRALVRQLALLVKRKAAALNIQSDWAFLEAVARYDTGEVVADTNGKNVLRWIVEDLGLAADPHAHETRYNYADVAWLHARLGVTPSRVVGGFLYDPPENFQGWEQHEQGVRGRVFPEAFWKADILWGAGTLLHRGNDDRTYGVWKPKDKHHFQTHDEARRLIYIGGGCNAGGAAANGRAGVERILEAIATGAAPAEGFYTTHLFVPQAALSPDSLARIEAEIDAVNRYVAQGRAVWSPLTATAERWRKDYGARPFQFSCASIPAPRKISSNRYLYVFHNINHFLEESDQALAVEAYRGLEEVARAHGATAEPFFTGLSFEMHLARSPELLRALKESGRDYHHHGANRPPEPQLIARVGNRPWAEAIRTVEEYERSALDARTGQLDTTRTGGLARMVEYFGRPPLATGRFVRAPILAAIAARYGVRMAVGTHDWFGMESAWLWYLGALNRPDDVFVHPNNDFPFDVNARIGRRLELLDPDAPAFMCFGFHNNDLFGYNRENSRRFDAGRRKQYLGRIDAFLRWATREQGFQPVTLRRVYEMARNNLVEARPADAPAFAAEILDSARSRRSLPRWVHSPRGGHSLVEAWQVLAGAVAGGVAPRPKLGPLEMEPPAARPLRVPSGDVRAALLALAPGEAVPSRVRVGTASVNAAEFLCLMAGVVHGDGEVETPPLSPAPPVQARQARFQDPLSLLQMWTLRPAYYDRPGGTLQRATSVEVNIAPPPPRRGAGAAMGAGKLVR